MKKKVVYMLTLESGLMTCYYTINGVTLGIEFNALYTLSIRGK